MGHLTPKKFTLLQHRLDKAVQGAPESETLLKILEIMFTKDEASFMYKLPLNLFTLEQASNIWKKPKNETKIILDKLADKGFLFDLEGNNTKGYFVVPPMLGFFEFVFMRTHGTFDKDLLAELFHQYVDEEGDLTLSLFMNDPGIERVFPQENALEKQKEKPSTILNYEKVSHIIETATDVAVGICYCRHKNEHLGKACDNPQRTCLSFNQVATSLIKHDIAEKIDKKEAFEIVNDSIKRGLVQTGDNIQNNVNTICNCCSCCCGILDAYKKFGYTDNFTSNFISKSGKNCVGCGLCETKCPVGAAIIKKNDKGLRRVIIDIKKCIGCGICVNICPRTNLSLVRKEKIKVVPKDTFERIIMEAMNDGKLQNYIFDNQTSITQDILRKFLKVIFSLPPSKFMIANNQLRSKFLNVLINRKKFSLFKNIYYRDKKIDYTHNELDKMSENIKK